jgi:hypothetical protein
MAAGSLWAMQMEQFWSGHRKIRRAQSTSQAREVASSSSCSHRETDGWLFKKERKLPGSMIFTDILVSESAPPLRTGLDLLWAQVFMVLLPFLS